MNLNPWKSARESEQRAESADERARVAEGLAAQLAQQLRWMQEQIQHYREGEVHAYKVMVNMTAQRQFGFSPFPEAGQVLTKSEPDIRGMMAAMSAEEEDPVDRARREFIEAELEDFGK